jgi:hypothetical protein
MSIALGHARRFVPEQPLDFVQVHPGLDQSSSKGMAQIVEMKILNLCGLQGCGKSSSKVAAIQLGTGFAAEHDRFSIPRSPRHCSYL